MAIGERIRYFRTMKNLTQKELGVMLGYPERAADVRVAQYESGTRVPKQATIEKLAMIFDVAEYAFTVPDIDSYIGLMHTLFVLEDKNNLHITQINEDEYCIKLDRFTQHPEAFEMHRLFKMWHNEYQKFLDGEITQEEYNHWRYTYPRVEAERTQEKLYKALDEKKKSE